MASIPEAFASAMQHHQAGQLQSAEHLYRQILAVDPNHADALHLLGLIALQQRNYEFAVQVISRAITLNAAEAKFHSSLATVFQAQGRIDEAIDCFRRTLELNPNLATVHNELGIALWGQGNLQQAFECFHKAAELNPEFPDAQINLGMAFHTQGNLDRAVECYRRALQLNSDLPEALNNLGNALYAKGQLDDAVASYRRALEIRPDFAAAHSNLGNVYHVQNKLDLAAASLHRALELKPDFADALANLGPVLLAQGKVDQAVDACRQALKIRPDHAEAHSNLGNALKDQGQLDDAIASFRRALQLKPDCFAAYSHLLYTLWFSPSYNSAAIYEQHRRWNQQWAQPLASQILPHANDPSPNRRLRIGYISPDFRSHVLAMIFVPLFSAHDRQYFEIVCYADVASPDSLTARLRLTVDAWRDIAGLTDEAVSQLVRQDQIDILVDLTMHMDHGHPFVFARKPAPVQVCWLAYPGTTGLSAIDYRLTDPYLDPPGLDDRYYSEQSVRLNDCFWCYDPLTVGPSVNPLPAQNNGYVTFGCLNNFCKVNAGVLALWARVMNAVQRSRLLLLAPEGAGRQAVLDAMNQAGIASGRLAFIARQPRSEYLELYHQIDMGLDTFPYNGHMTSLDSFWMGVPVITLVGETVVGRAGLCQLHNLALPELIAHTPEQFVELCGRLANDLPRLSQLRATLRQTIEQSPLMDAARFARSCEAADRTMWQTWCAQRRSA